MVAVVKKTTIFVPVGSSYVVAAVVFYLFVVYTRVL
jgi:hypothetical protein